MWVHGRHPQLHRNRLARSAPQRRPARQGANPRKRVRVECYEQPDKGLLFVIRDSGPGFDPALVPDPTHAENLLRETGRGLFMIRHYMDGVEFSRGGREIRMSKNR